MEIMCASAILKVCLLEELGEWMGAMSEHILIAGMLATSRVIWIITIIVALT